MKQLLIITAILLSSLSALAYLELNETAELVPNDGKYRVGFFPQIFISNGGGTNIGAFIDTYIDADINSRFTLGGGSTDFWASASAKWVPFPDYKEQPALGFRGGFTYGFGKFPLDSQQDKKSIFNLQFTPITSKVIETDYGKMNPYLGVPVTFVSTGVTAVQLMVGAEWLHSQDFQMGGELEMNLQNAFSALSVYFNFPFDEKTGFKK